MAENGKETLERLRAAQAKAGDLTRTLSALEILPCLPVRVDVDGESLATGLSALFELLY